MRERSRSATFAALCLLVALAGCGGGSAESATAGAPTETAAAKTDVEEAAVAAPLDPQRVASQVARSRQRLQPPTDR